MVTLAVLLTVIAVVLFLAGISLACWPLLIPLGLDLCVVLLLCMKRRKKKALK